jgi:hypothetical protein
MEDWTHRDLKLITYFILFKIFKNFSPPPFPTNKNSYFLTQKEVQAWNHLLPGDEFTANHYQQALHMDWIKQGFQAWK